MQELPYRSARTENWLFKFGQKCIDKILNLPKSDREWYFVFPSSVWIKFLEKAHANNSFYYHIYLDYTMDHTHYQFNQYITKLEIEMHCYSQGRFFSGLLTIQLYDPLLFQYI